MPDEFTPENITEEQLKWGYWFVTHKLLFKRIAFIVFIAADAALIGWNAWQWFDIYVYNVEKYRQMVLENSTLVLGSGQTSKTPASLLVSNARIFSVDGKYDFVAEVKNPEANYRADFTYRFTASGTVTEPRSGFILPGDDKYLSVLGFETAMTPGQAVLEISDVRWMRVNRHEINDYQKFFSDRMNFKISDLQFVPADRVVIPGTSGSAETAGPAGETRFVFNNATGFGYKSIKFTALLYRGQELVAVNTQTVTDVASGEMRTIQIPWYQTLPAISDTRIIPEVDIMNDGVYLR